MDTKNRKPVLIDTDPGDDDATSILWAIASDKFDIKALTVTNGNVGVSKCIINALRTLEVCERTDIPVYGGAYKPLIRPSIEASWIHGQDGFGDLGFPLPATNAADGYAPVEMVRIAKESPEPITILALGPLTNIALAIALDPEFVDHVAEVIFMGGVMRFSGNETPRASYNVKVDPEAAKAVYNSSIPVVQAGLDVCDLVTQTVEDLDKITAANNRVTNFVTKLLSYRRFEAVKIIKDDKGEVVGELKAAEQVENRNGGIGLNDLTTTGYMINPGWFKSMHVAMDVETHGLCDGETIIDYKGLWGREPNGYFAYDVDGEALVEQWVKDLSTAFAHLTE